MISKSELKRAFQTHSFCLYSLFVTEKPLNQYDKVLTLTLLEKHIDLHIYPNYSGNKMPPKKRYIIIMRKLLSLSLSLTPPPPHPHITVVIGRKTPSYLLTLPLSSVLGLNMNATLKSKNVKTEILILVVHLAYLFHRRSVSPSKWPPPPSRTAGSRKSDLRCVPRLRDAR